MVNYDLVFKFSFLLVLRVCPWANGEGARFSDMYLLT
jgi:hypothetical protein